MHNQETRRHNPLPSSLTGMTGGGGGVSGTSVTWASPPTQATEIDRIMAKIEQARLSIANVCVRQETNHDRIQKRFDFFAKSPNFGFHARTTQDREPRLEVYPEKGQGSLTFQLS